MKLPRSILNLLDRIDLWQCKRRVRKANRKNPPLTLEDLNRYAASRNLNPKS